MKNKIKIDFKNILSELEQKCLKLCFVKGRGLFIEDSQENLYQMETYRVGSYLDKLIRNGITVEFEQINGVKIADWEKEIWDVLKVKDFIKRQSCYW